MAAPLRAATDAASIAITAELYIAYQIVPVQPPSETPLHVYWSASNRTKPEKYFLKPGSKAALVIPPASLATAPCAAGE